MDPKEREQNLSTSADLSLSDTNPKKKKQKLSKSQVIPSLSSLSKIDLGEAMKKQNDAALVLTGKVIASEARNSNFVFSPTSINAVITMLMAADSDSDERNAVFTEIATVVFADGSASGGPKITAINGVWVEQSLPVDHSLKDLLENVFKATFTQVDFISKAEQVRIELNKWASDHTDGLIRDILPPGSITSETFKVYGNALYFKGAWRNKFNKSLTKVEEFHLVSGKSVSVPFMSSRKKQYIKAYGGFKVLGLPYRQGDDNDGDTNRKFSMYFYLPHKKDGLDNLLEKMTSTPRFVDNHIPWEEVEVGDFRIPKFKISFGFEASKIEGLVAMTLYHKACVEIDEEGAEAAAVTFLAGRGGRGRPLPSPKRIDFVADHPFIFLIREDKTGTILFAGQIYNPE